MPFSLGVTANSDLRTQDITSTRDEAVFKMNLDRNRTKYFCDIQTLNKL